MMPRYAHLLALVALVMLVASGPVNAQNVTIPDANLRAKVNQRLGRATTSTLPITVSDMAGITILQGIGSNISNLTGLEHATGLQRLQLRNNNITNIDSLYASTNLHTLDLSENNITNIGVLSKLTGLRISLILRRNNITNIDSLYTLTNLRSLSLNENNITNIDSLYTLTNLTSLEATYNNITNIDSLSNLTELRLLRLDNNRISDISPLRNLTRLESLGLPFNNITDISPLMHLTSLTNYVTLNYNNITNLDSLSTLTNLDRLGLVANVNLSDISPLSTLTNLKRLNIYSNPSLSDISPLSTLTNLESIDARFSNISDISALSNLPLLRWVYLNTNRITDLSPLISNTGVGSGDFVRVYANPLSATSRNTHVPALRDRGVNVTLSPVITLSLSSSAIGENGATATITATLDQAHRTFATTITVAAAPGANAVSADFTLSNNPVLTIAVGATTSTGTVTITAVDNSVSASDKTVTVSATSLGRVLRSGRAVPDVTPPLPVPLTILDDESPVTTLVLSRSEIDESGATNQTTVTATLTRASSAATTITVAATPGANAVSADFTLSNNPVLTIAANATTSTGTVTITAVDNSVSAGDKAVTVSGNAQNSAGVASPSDVTLTIRDDEPPSRAEDPVENPAAANQVPEFTDVVDFQRYQQGTPIAPLIFPVAQGGDGALTYTLSPLPPGLTYTPPSEDDAHGGVLSGTPTETQAKATYALTATDEDEDVAQALFYIVVMVATSSGVEADRMPSFGDATVAAQSYVQNREIEAITLPRATGGDGALTYALSPDLPEGLTFNTETRVLSGLPTEALGETTYTLTARDGDGDEATLRFALAVAEDLMPSFPDTVVAHRYLVNTDVEITFPEATGGDGALAYILLPFLPDELEFDHETRVISGTLLQAILETEYTLSALDADGDVASLVFTLEGLTPDFDGNGRVNFADFALFVVRYGTRHGEERYNSRYDLNSDGAVGYDDFLIFRQYYDTEI